MNIDEVLSFIDHSWDFFHVNFYMIDVEFVQKLFEEVLKVAYWSFGNLLAIETLVCEGDLRSVKHILLQARFYNYNAKI